MNYDGIIVELIGRIQRLEKDVASLMQQSNECQELTKVEEKHTTADIRKYIENQIGNALKQNLDSITLRASDIHRNMRLKSRFPMVCNAMRQCMNPGDIVIHETPSGFSSSLEIQYFCDAFSLIWTRILSLQGEPFYLVTGDEFTYEVNGDILYPLHIQSHFPTKTDFQKAFELRKIDSVDQLRKEGVEGPSYVFAILSDERVNELLR